MKRYAATIILGLGLVFGVVIGGANMASAATTAHATNSSSFTFDSGVGTKPGHGSGLGHMKATKVGTSSNTDPYKAPTTSPKAATPPAATPSPAANTVATSPASSLAFTGADVTGAVVLGLLLIGGGLVLVGFTRRQQLA